MTARSRILALTLAACLAAPLAVAEPAGATGTEQSKPADQIAADAEKAMLGAKNFHVRGYIDQATGPVSLNVTTSPNGGGGSIQLPGATLQVVVAAQKVYVKADEKSWLKLTGSKTTADLLSNRWAEAPDTNPNFANLAGITNSKILFGPTHLRAGQVVQAPGGNQLGWP